MGAAAAVKTESEGSPAAAAIGEESSKTFTPERKVLSRSFSVGGDESCVLSLPDRHLRLMMLGCEDNPPYGPTNHTACLFLSLICRAIQAKQATSKQEQKWTISIHIYRVQQLEYPTSSEEWDSYDGILLPGSFSAAYDKNEWIEKLTNVIATEVHGKSRKTFAICFGHQIYAHSFHQGQATKCPAGMQAGRRTVSLTNEGNAMFSNVDLQLLFTHGDMVKTLPPCALRLGGSEHVPVQAAAYFSTKEHVSNYLESGTNDEERPTPIAITFQAHPEYADVDLGVHDTLNKILASCEKRGVLQLEAVEEARNDVSGNYVQVEQNSLQVMMVVGTIFGWF